MKQAGYEAAEHVDVADHRHLRERPVAHVGHQLAGFACVEADLGNDKISTVLDFLFEFVILGEQGVFGAFERRANRSRKEISAVEFFSFVARGATLHFEPIVHALDDM